MHCGFDKTVLTLTEVVTKFIEVVQAGIPGSLLDGVNPLRLLLLRLKVVDAALVRED